MYGRLSWAPVGGRARQKPPFPRTPSSPQPVIPNPFTVIPSEAEGPETAADNNTTVQEPTRPPSCRETRYPRGAGGARVRSIRAMPHPHTSLVLPDSDPVPTPLSSSPTPIEDPGARLPPTHPRPIHNPPVPTPLFVVPGTPGTHGGARVGRYPNHEHARPPGAHPHLPRLAGLRSGTHPFFVFPDSDRGPTRHSPVDTPPPIPLS